MVEGAPRGAEDPDIERVLQWFRGFMRAGEWDARVTAIEDHLEAVGTPHATRAMATDFRSVSASRDRMGWYLYLAETYQRAPLRYEPAQGARVIPVFKRLGTDFERLLSVGNVREAAKRLVGSEREQADSGLFELLVAVQWVRNGWSTVELLEATPAEKRPDIRAATASREWFVECKRMAKTSHYSELERARWLKMWRPLADALIDRALPYVFDIVFHVPLTTLPDDFMTRELVGKVGLLAPPCKIFDDERWTVSVHYVDFGRIREHLKRYMVKNPSEQLVELVGGRREASRGFTYGMKAKGLRSRGERGNNRFVEAVEFAYGSYWSCDAKAAIEAKARDIRRHLAEASSQLPDNRPSVVQVGIETYEGALVEEARYRKIADSVFAFDVGRKDLRWIYCHVYQAYSPPEEDWVIDETVHHFTHRRHLSDEPLTSRWTIVPDTTEPIAGGHWDRPPP